MAALARAPSAALVYFDGISCPTTRRELARRRPPARRDRCRSRCPCRAACRRHPRSPGCRSRRARTGSRPARRRRESTVATPMPTATSTLASAVPRVSWKCTRDLVDGRHRQHLLEHRLAPAAAWPRRWCRRARSGRRRAGAAPRPARPPCARIDRALVRAAEHRRDVGAHAHARRRRRRDHLLERGQRLGDGLVHVLLVVRLRRRQEDRHLLHARVERLLQALAVGHQAGVDHALLALDAARHVAGVGELRDPLRVDEAGDLDVREAGRGERVDHGDLVAGGDRPRLVLQAVARADLVDRHPLGKPIEHLVSRFKSKRRGMPAADRSRSKAYRRRRRPRPAAARRSCRRARR